MARMHIVSLLGAAVVLLLVAGGPVHARGIIPKSRITSIYRMPGEKPPPEQELPEGKHIDPKKKDVYDLMDLLLHQAVSPDANVHSTYVTDPMYPGRPKEVGLVLHSFIRTGNAERNSREEIEARIIDMLFQYPELVEYYRSRLESTRNLMGKFEEEKKRRLAANTGDLPTLDGCPRGPEGAPSNKAFTELPGWKVPPINDKQRETIRAMNLRLVKEGEDNVFSNLSPATRQQPWFKSTLREYCQPWTRDWRWLYYKATASPGSMNVAGMQTLANCWEYRSYLRSGNTLSAQQFLKTHPCDMKQFASILNSANTSGTDECIGLRPREKWYRLLDQRKCMNCPPGTSFRNDEKNGVMGCEKSPY